MEQNIVLPRLHSLGGQYADLAAFTSCSSIHRDSLHLDQARVKIKTIAESSNNRLIALARSVLCCEGGRVLRRERVSSYWLFQIQGVRLSHPLALGISSA